MTQTIQAILPHSDQAYITPIKSNRRRGAILTEQGWQKLQQAGVLYDEFGKRYTYEELSEQTQLDPRTVSRIVSCEVKVDKRTLKTFFHAFKLQLESGDYTAPR